jgi:hypothetical protein
VDAVETVASLQAQLQEVREVKGVLLVGCMRGLSVLGGFLQVQGVEPTHSSSIGAALVFCFVYLGTLHSH